MSSKTQHASLLVLHAELLTMRGDGVGYVRGGALAVAEGGAILAVGTAEELRGRFTATSTLDASGCVVMPGLVDARMRSRDAVQRAAGLSKVAAERSHAAVLAGARLAALEGLKAGTTLFCDVGSPFLGWAETYERAGARACLALELCADGQGGAQHARAQLAQAASFARQYHGAAGRRVLCQLAPAHATALPDEVLREADAIAKRLGTSLHVPLAEGASHAHEKQQFASQGRQSAARHRHTGSAVFAAASSSSDVERLDGAGVLSPRMLAAHLTHCSVEEAATVAFKCGRMVCVPTSATLRAGRAGPVREFRAAGGACGLGTGSAAEGCSHSLWGEARAAALAAKLSARDGAELPASDALRMATVEGARALGVGAAVGALDVGMQADFVMLRLDRAALLLPRPAPGADSGRGAPGTGAGHFGWWSSAANGGPRGAGPGAPADEDALRSDRLARAVLWGATPQSVEMVVVAGKVVVRGGRVLTMDESEVIADAQSVADLLDTQQRHVAQADA